MKKILSAVVLSLFVFMSTSAQAQDRPTVNVSTAFWTQYLGNLGFRLSKAQPVIQSDATVSFKGFRLNVWNSKTLDGKFDKAGNETDVTVAWKGFLLPGEGLSSIRWDIGIDTIILPHGNRTIEPFFQIDHEFHPNDRNTVTPFLRVEVNFPNKEIGTTNTYWGFGHSFKFFNWLRLHHNIALLTDSNIKTKLQPSLLYRATLKFKFTDNFSADLSVKATTPTHRLDIRRPEAAYGIGLSYTF